CAFEFQATSCNGSVQQVIAQEVIVFSPPSYRDVLGHCLRNEHFLHTALDRPANGVFSHLENQSYMLITCVESKDFEHGNQRLLRSCARPCHDGRSSRPQPDYAAVDE